MVELIKNLRDLKKGINKSLDFYNLLFSSMLTSAELYLSNNFSRKNMTKAKRKKLTGLLKMTGSKSAKSAGIEKMLDLNLFQKIMPFNKAFENSGGNRNLKYGSKTKQNSFAKELLKNPYSSFINYGSKGYGSGKKGYTAIKNNAKKVAGFVKYSLEKYIKVFQFVLAIAMPQWNMPWGSKNDYDTLAHAVSPNSSVDEKNMKYHFAYSSLRYSIY